MLRKKGFTLVEMLFVVVIALSIVAFAVPAYKRTKIRAQYDASTGILFSIGNAARTLNRELGEHYVLCKLPQSGTNFQMPEKYDSSIQAIAANETAAHFVCAGTNNEQKHRRGVNVLFDQHYLEPFEGKSDYIFYLVDKTSGICKEQCTRPSNSAFTVTYANVVACMCLPDSIASDSDYDCFYGARLSNTGLVERFVNPDGDCSY